MAGLKSEIKNNRICVLMMNEGDYNKHMNAIVSAVLEIYKKPCYVSLNKPYATISKKLEACGICIEDIFFIDAVTENVNEVSDTDNVIYISSPRALTELNIAIKKAIEGRGIDSVIFDSLSTLLIYEGSAVVVKFVHSIISDFRIKNTACVFVMISDDASENLIKDIGMFVDNIFEVGGK